MDRREFTGMIPALLALGSVGVSKELEAEGQAKLGTLPVLASGVWKPGPQKVAGDKRTSHAYLTGMLAAGKVRLEMHSSSQEAGAPHEAIGTHLHNEIWLVREGTVELMTNGVTRRLEAGDVGICVAGDKHFIANVGDTRASYFVVTVGPPE
jgi:quercetin dioxygenase-like cupin family protein